MQRQTPLNSSFRAYIAGGARGCAHEADDTQMMQEVKINFMKDEICDTVEHPQPYGFTGYFRKAEYDKNGEIEKCAEHFAQFMGGNRSFPVCAVLDDRRYRLHNFEEGEVAIYDDQQQSIKIKRREIQTRSQKRITFRLIKDEEQHKPEKSRDQQKSEDKPLSSLMMDKDSVHILRSDDSGKLAAKPDEQDKEGKMKSRGVWMKNDDETDMIIIETPQTHMRWNEKDETITISTNTKSITFDDKDKETIVIKTEICTITLDDKGKKITIETPNTAVVVNENIKMTQVGDKTADKPIAHLGSITSDGAVIVGNVAKKALVK